MCINKTINHITLPPPSLPLQSYVRNVHAAHVGVAAARNLDFLPQRRQRELREHFLQKK